jgi:hypothetical protein
VLASAPGAVLEEEGARLGHPAREVLERDGESGKRTLLLASKFTETPGCNVTLCRIHHVGTNLERRRKVNITMQPVTSTHGSLRQANPVLHGVPFSVIPNQQVLVGQYGHWIGRSWLGSILRLSENFRSDAGMTLLCGRGNGRQNITIRRNERRSSFSHTAAWSARS